MQEAAVTAASEELKSEPQIPGADLSEVTARHAEELRALEAKLVGKHEEEFESGHREGSPKVVGLLLLLTIRFQRLSTSKLSKQPLKEVGWNLWHQVQGPFFEDVEILKITRKNIVKKCADWFTQVTKGTRTTSRSSIVHRVRIFL